MDHKLTLMENTAYTSGLSFCNLCFLQISGPVYHCSVCEYDIHPGCAATGLAEGHFLHPKHPLRRIESNVNRSCDGCGLKIQSACYNCPFPCDFDLHPTCTRAPMYVQHPFHTHILKLVTAADPRDPATTAEPTSTAVQPCLACGQILDTPSSYRCTVCKNVGLHSFCLQLPWTPMLPIHPDHRMFLKNSADGSTASLTCNACQNPTKSKWVYQCTECKYNLHTDCADLPHHIPGEPVATPSPMQTRLEMHRTIRDIISKRHKIPSSN